MATVNLGRIKPVFKSTWANGTTYAVDDFVVHGNECYICIQAGAGQNPTSASAYWTKIAAKGTDGTDVGATLTTQGDILYRDGSGLQRLAKGTATQILQINAGATAPEWTAKPEGKIVKMSYYENTTQYSNTNNSTDVQATNHSITFTPSAANNILFIEYMPNVRQNSGASDISFRYKITRTIGGSASTFYEDSTQVESYYYDSSGGQRIQFPRYFLHRDNTHNTTSAITYSVGFRNPHSSRELFISSDNAPSRWRVTEIKP